MLPSHFLINTLHSWALGDTLTLNTFALISTYTNVKHSTHSISLITSTILLTLSHKPIFYTYHSTMGHSLVPILNTRLLLMIQPSTKHQIEYHALLISNTNLMILDWYMDHLTIWIYIYLEQACWHWYQLLESQLILFTLFATIGTNSNYTDPTIELLLQGTALWVISKLMPIAHLPNQEPLTDSQATLPTINIDTQDTNLIASYQTTTLSKEPRELMK